MIEVGNVVMQWVSSVGFPIVMCLILIHYLEDIEATYQKELRQLRKSIDSNTQLITKLCERLSK